MASNDTDSSRPKPVETDVPLAVNPSDDANAKAEYKAQCFDRELRQFIKQAEETITARYGVTIELGDIRPELVCIHRYLGIYNSMLPREHYCYFETLYNRNRHGVINCLKEDRWIREGRLIVQFGEGIKGMAERCKQVRIPVSDVFLIACELRDKAEKGLDGIDPMFMQGVGGKDLIRPNILLLHLTRIFYYLTDGNDKLLLGDIVTQLENELHVTKKTVTDVANLISPQQATATAVGGLSGLFTMATNIMQKMGHKIPEDMKPPSEQEISNVIGAVFNNETTQNAISGVFGSLQGSKDLGSALQSVIGSVTDPATMNAIQESVMQTTQAAALSGIHGTNNPQSYSPPLKSIEGGHERE